MSRRVAVIGVGNTLMGDDGVGVRAAEELESMGIAARVTVGHLAGPLLMPAVMEADGVVFVDALAADDEPGTIYRMDPDEAGITKLRSTTSHGLGIPHLITNARLLGHHPEFVVYAVHIGDIMCGPDTLTPKVAAALPKVVNLVAEEVARMQAQ